jgi:hypothetical protein
VSEKEVEEVARSALELLGGDLNALALPPSATALDYADGRVLAGCRCR